MRCEMATIAVASRALGLLKSLSPLIAQLGKAERTVAGVLIVGLKNHPLDLANETVGRPMSGRAQLLDELLRKVAGTREGRCSSRIAPIESSRNLGAAAPSKTYRSISKE